MTVEDVNQLCKNTLIEHLGIEFTEIGIGYIVARMPVDNRTMQPMNLLHGGASMALAETVGSVGSYVMIDQTKFDVLGIEINGNHIGNTNAKYVVATGVVIHKGLKTHVWDIKISDQYNNPISLCRITNMILEKKGE